MESPKKIGIIEDEVLIAASLESTLRKMGYQTLEPAHNYEEGMALAKNNEIDLYLIDINLGDGKSGIDIARFIRAERSRPLIFVTAYSSKSTINQTKLICPDAFLVKPASKDQLISSIEIAINNFETIENNKHRPQSIIIKDGYEHIRVDINDILYLCSDHNYVTFYLKDGQKIMERNTIKALEKKLSPIGFVKINRSVILNTVNVDKIDSNTAKIGDVSFKLNRKARERLLEVL